MVDESILHFITVPTKLQDYAFEFCLNCSIPNPWPGICPCFPFFSPIVALVTQEKTPNFLKVLFTESPSGTACSRAMPLLSLCGEYSPVHCLFSCRRCHAIRRCQLACHDYVLPVYSLFQPRKSCRLFLCSLVL